MITILMSKKFYIGMHKYTLKNIFISYVRNARKSMLHIIIGCKK